MSYALRFDESKYEVKTCHLDGRSITYRAFEEIEYCRKPLDPIQKLNIFVPEIYYKGETLNGYDLHKAPIFMPNTVGGYMPGVADQPGLDHLGRVNSVFEALEHGYVVASAGVRGRTSGKRSTEFFEGSTAGITGENTGRMVGRAPAFIVDLKAAIRYLHYNKDRIPGNTDYIITNGTSAGGALSALAGATGNSPDYEPYLQEIGAAEEKDDIFASSCYCPIHNLENADTAYEWMFCGENNFYRTRHKKTEDGKVIRVPFNGAMTQKQVEASKELKKLFPAYLNSLHLKDEDGNELTLNENGEGTFKTHVKKYILQSAQKERKTHQCRNEFSKLAVAGSEIDEQNYLIMEGENIVDFDWDCFIKKITRMKATPAFDAFDLKSPENEEFGSEVIDGKHFTKYSWEHSEVNGTLADPSVVKMLNPISYIGEADTAKYWRIRHGSFDRDTSLAIPVILASMLENKGFNVDFFLPWGLPHGGDYDLDELFQWIDKICKQQ